MAYIRIFHQNDFDPTVGKFADVSLRKASSDGISVIASDCVQSSGRCVCEHIRLYYPHVAGEPPIYLVIPNEYLPSNCRMEHKRSLSGDDCHWIIGGLTRGEKRIFSRQIINQFPLDAYRICADGCERELRKEDIPDPVIYADSNTAN